MSAALEPEDAKLIALARSARARIQAAQGGAVRDDMGRTYSGASVSLGDVHLSALQLATAQAVAAGARGLEAAVLVAAGEQELDAADLDCVRALGGGGVPVLCCDADGAVRSTVST